jgi:hypothetical protein
MQKLFAFLYLKTRLTLSLFLDVRVMEMYEDYKNWYIKFTPLMKWPLTPSKFLSWKSFYRLLGDHINKIRKNKVQENEVP